MATYVQKPKFVEAWIVPDVVSLRNVRKFLKMNGLPDWHPGGFSGRHGIVIDTMCGRQIAEPGDYIVLTREGFYYPERPHEFEQKYEPVNK